jgi:hypothetical protein
MHKIDFVTTDCEDLGCHTGATFLVTLYCFQSCGSDLPVDLTGYTADLIIYEVTESTPTLTVSGTIANPANGLIQFLISPDDTGDLEIGEYSHVINLNIGTNVFRTAYGKFEVTE